MEQAEPVTTQHDEIKVLAAGVANGEPVRLIEHSDGSCGIVIGDDAEHEVYRWGPGHVEDCAHNFLRLIRLPVH